MLEIYVDSTLIDTFDDVPLSLNYGIADIREPQNRDGSLTKTLTLPGSKANNKLFGLMFSVDVKVGTFDPNVKKDAVIRYNGLTVISGSFQLLTINVLEDDRIEYEGQIVGKLASVFRDIEDQELTDLDFSEYDHTYDKATQVASWTATKGEGYVYPMEDRGQNNLVDYAVEDFLPALYLKDFIDKIICGNGFQYQSDFFTSDYFKSLIIPFSSEKFNLTDEQIENREVFATAVSESNSILFGLGTYATLKYDGEDADVGNNYNTTTYKYTVPAKGDYTFDVRAMLGVYYLPTGGDSYYQGTHQGWMEIVRDESGSITVLASRQVNFNQVASNQVLTNFTAFVTTPATNALSSPVVTLNAGDDVYVRINGWNYNWPTYPLNTGSIFTRVSDGTQVGGSVSWRMMPGSIFNCRVVNSRFKEGDTIPANNIVPIDIKQRDLFLSVIRAFNLYIDVDKRNPKKLYIEPRNDYYTSGTIKDWTSKLDISQEFKIEPMGALDARQYIYTYDMDEDFTNKRYFDRYREVYGSRIEDIPNDFVKEKNETKLIFASTPSVGYDFTDRVLPSIKFVNDNGLVEEKSSKIRLLYYGGVKGTITGWNYLDSSGSEARNQYPFAGHLDDPYNSTEDIQFLPPKEIYYTSGTIYYTNNNLYNKYHKQFINEITNANSKVVTAWFRLSSLDIQDFEFWDQVRVDGQLYYVNRIIDFDPQNEAPTQVELLKIAAGTPFTATSGLVVGGNDGTEMSSGDFAPVMNYDDYLGSDPLTDGNTLTSNNNFYGGASQFVSGNGVGNIIGDGALAIHLINSSGNVIGGGLTNVTLINTSGKVITDSNQLWVNNRRFLNPVLNFDAPGAATPANTNKNTLALYRLPAGTLVNDGDVLEIKAIFQGAANGNTKNYGFDLATYSYQFTSTGSSEYVNIVARITKLAASYSIVTSVTTSAGSADADYNVDFFDLETTDLNVVWTGQNGTASAGDITLFEHNENVLPKQIDKHAG